MRWKNTVASYLPSLIVNHLINRTTNEDLPSRQEYETVCLFADVSGFTALSEAMMSSAEGVEGLARHLNSYFGQMVKIIASEGGDVFKFAGDALIVLWPPPAREALTDIAKKGREKESGERDGDTPMERRVRRAAQCAFAIQESLHRAKLTTDAELTTEVRLSVKIGIGMGKVSVLHLGGVYKRMEYIAVGEPLSQAFTAEHHATAGDVIISLQAHKLVKDHFREKHRFDDGYCRIGKDHNYNPMRKQNKTNMLQQTLEDPLLELKVKGYIPGAVLRNLRPDSPEDEHWSDEIRRVTVLFVNLGLKEQTLLAAADYDEAMKEVHQVMVAVQESVYEYEGSINKFLMDDKGSTLVAVYGLPPVGHADDPTRGVLAALRLCERLFDLGKVGSVGITTGEAFCGVVGSKTRKEYTVLGDSVNLAARLMQRAMAEDGGVICELATKRACGGLLQFKGRGDVRVKGKTAAAKVFQPYPEDFPKPDPPQYLGANMYGLIHQQQRQNYAMHKLLTSLQAYFARPAVKDISSPASPASDTRTRFSGTVRGSAYNPRPSILSAPGNNMDEDGAEEKEVDMLGGVGMGGHDSDVSDDGQDDTIGNLLENHAELQEPSFSTESMHLFQTGPLPSTLVMGVDDEVPYQGVSNGLRPSGDVSDGGQAGGGRVALVPVMSPGSEGAAGDDNDPDIASQPPSIPRLEIVGKSRNSRDMFNEPGVQWQNGAQTTSGVADSGGGDNSDIGAAPAATMEGARSAKGKEQMLKSSSLTKVFAAARSEQNSTARSFMASAKSSAAPARSSAAWTPGTAVVGEGDAASPEILSPTSTSADALPRRGLNGRRQGDSSHLQKLFRTADDGHSMSSSQPPSPSSKVPSKELERSDSSKSLALASNASGPAAGSSSIITPPNDAVVVQSSALGNCSSGSRRGRGGGGGGGGGVIRHHGAGVVIPRSRMDRGADDNNGDGGGDNRNELAEGSTVSEQGRVIAVGAKSMDGTLEERKIELREEGTNVSNAGDFKLAQAASKVKRASFKRPVSGRVVVDDDEVLPSNYRVGLRRRSSTRLSVSQNGMVPLPASAGIPQSDLGASGSCSLPRYSKYFKQFGAGGSGSSGLSAGYGYSRSNHPVLPSSVAMNQSFSGSSHASAATTLTGGPSALSAYIPYAAKSGRRMDDSASSSSASLNGGTDLHGRASMRAYNAASGDGYDNEYRLQVVVPRHWKWSSLPDYCLRLPSIDTSETHTFRELVDRCWEAACDELEVKGWSQPAPHRQDMVLNILGTRVMLPTEPDYEINMLPHFVKEAFGTKGFKGFSERRRPSTQDAAVGSGSVDLCLLPRMEILNVQSRWLNSRISLLQRKIALVSTETGSVSLLEGLPGSGKTEVLSVFAARTMPRTALIHFTAASPYCVNKDFGGWSMVLQQYLDSLHKRETQAGNQDSSVHGGVRRYSVPPGAGGVRSEEANGASILGQKQPSGRDRVVLRELDGFPELQQHAFLVNDVLGTNMPNNVQTWDKDSHSSASSSFSMDGERKNGNEWNGSDFDDSCSVGHEQRLKLSILLQLVKNMASTKHRIVVIDDAQFLDKYSWTLALHVATGGPMGTPLPLMLILSFRPLLHYRAIFSAIAPDYKALTEVDHVHFMKISGAPVEEVEELVSEKLGTNVWDISDSLFELMEQLCTGNPLMITELVSHLKMMEPTQLRYIEIRSEEGNQGDSHNNIEVAVQVSLTDRFRLSAALLPEKLNALLTSQTDRLNSCQLMALKVASLIGKKFSTWFLYEVYPIKGHKDRLLRELAELEEQGFLMEVQGSDASLVIEEEGWDRPSIAFAAQGMSLTRPIIGGGSDGSRAVERDSSRHLWGIPNVVYTFTHGFMMEMLQLKMLKKHTNQLMTSIHKLKDRLETQKRHKDLKQNQNVDRSLEQKTGTLYVMKYKVTMSQAATNARESTRRPKETVTSRAMRRVKRPVQQKWTEKLDWKKRTCKLTGESLSLYNPKDKDSEQAAQIVYLNGATAEPELGQAFKDSAFRVETNKWRKGDELVDGTERRTFTFLAETKDDRELWLYQIKRCIEVIKVLNGGAGSGDKDNKQQSSGRSNRFFSNRFGVTDSGNSSDTEEEVDSTLVVTVEQANDLILEEDFGTVYPYCLVSLDDQNQRTTSVQSASVNPSWQQDLRFQVSAQQWVLSNLRIQVWHRDLFLTDDFLGHVTIPLKDITVKNWDEYDDVSASPPEERDLKWYNLESRGHANRCKGRLQLGVRLIMNKPTSERASAVGGVDKVKAFVERRINVSSHAARVGQIRQRKQSIPDLLHHASPSADSHNAHHHHPGGMGRITGMGRSMSAGGGGGGIPETYIRASIRSMESELGGLVSRRAASVSGRLGSGLSRARPGLGGTDASGSQDGDCSRHSVDAGGEGSGPEGDTTAGAAGSGIPAPRMSTRSRRRSTGVRGRGSRRTASDSSSLSISGIGLTGMGMEPLHADPLTRQLMLMLLAVETKAEVSIPEERRGGAVNREWIMLKLKELLTMVGRNDVDLDHLDTHTYYCKDRKENQYGPFPAKQLVEAHNAGYINDRKVLVKEARFKGDFRPMGAARAVMHGPSVDEAVKSLTTWPQVDAHHPLADRILSPGDGPSKDFRQWGFNIFGLEKQELGMLAATVLAETGLPRTFGINMKTFAQFMSAVGFFMERNPRVSYHNLYHALDVMHAAFLMLGDMGASGLLTETEQLALILSALCHDLDHPGLTNSFQISTESPLANLYNDQAPLEHHHLAVMFQILRREGCDILGHLEKAQRTRIREVMVQGILATEMSEHGTHIHKVDKLTHDFPIITHRIAKWASGSIGRGWDRSNPVLSSSPPLPATEFHAMSALSSSSSMSGGSRMGSRALLQVPGAEAAALGFADRDRLSVASALLHAADLSSPGRPFATCKVWVVLLLEEFKFQAEQERQRGLRVTVLEGSPSASQPNFIDAYLLPFFTALLPMAPGLSDEYIPNLRTNRERWEAIAEQEAQLASPDDPLADNGNIGNVNPNNKPVDGSSPGSASSGLGSTVGGRRNSGGPGGGGGAHNNDGGDEAGDLLRPLSASSSGTFEGQRRYSGGTIGIASMLGSLGIVPTGRSISDGYTDRRSSSILGSISGVSLEFAGVGRSNAAWRRQSAMGPGTGSAAEFGYPKWGPIRASDPPAAAAWGGGATDEEISRGAASEATAAGKAAATGSSIPVDVAEEGKKSSREEKEGATGGGGLEQVGGEGEVEGAQPTHVTPEVVPEAMRE